MLKRRTRSSRRGGNHWAWNNKTYVQTSLSNINIFAQMVKPPPPPPTWLNVNQSFNIYLWIFFLSRTAGVQNYKVIQHHTELSIARYLIFVFIIVLLYGYWKITELNFCPYRSIVTHREFWHSVLLYKAVFGWATWPRSYRRLVYCSFLNCIFFSGFAALAFLVCVQCCPKYT